MSSANNIGVGNNINLGYIKIYNDELKIKKNKLFHELGEIEHNYKILNELIIEQRLLGNDEEKIDIFSKTQKNIITFFLKFYIDFGTFDEYLTNLEKKKSKQNNNNFLIIQ